MVSAFGMNTVILKNVTQYHEHDRLDNMHGLILFAHKFVLANGLFMSIVLFAVYAISFPSFSDTGIFTLPILLTVSLAIIFNSQISLYQSELASFAKVLYAQFPILVLRPLLLLLLAAAFYIGGARFDEILLLLMLIVVTLVVFVVIRFARDRCVLKWTPVSRQK